MGHSKTESFDGEPKPLIGRTGRARLGWAARSGQSEASPCYRQTPEHQIIVHYDCDCAEQLSADEGQMAACQESGGHIPVTLCSGLPVVLHLYRYRVCQQGPSPHVTSTPHHGLGAWRL